MRYVVAVALLALAPVSTSYVEQVQVQGAKVYSRPSLVTRAFPMVQIFDIAHGCSTVQLTARIVGPEDERWYCPRVTWEKPDDTLSVVESDCPPFEERNECYPKLPAKCVPGWYRDRSGEIHDNMEQAGCECNIIGYPRVWRLNLCYPADPDGGAWEVRVRLEKGKDTVTRIPVRFYIK